MIEKFPKDAENKRGSAMERKKSQENIRRMEVRISFEDLRNLLRQNLQEVSESRLLQVLEAHEVKMVDKALEEGLEHDRKMDTTSKPS